VTKTISQSRYPFGTSRYVRPGCDGPENSEKIDKGIN
jgi:hypothetical protein